MPVKKESQQGQRIPAEVAYDFWPWPDVDLVNDKPWPAGVSWENRARMRPAPRPPEVRRG